MAETTRSGPGSLVGHAYYDIDGLSTYSFCPDSNDASTPATQVHVAIQLKGTALGFGMRRPAPPPMVMRFHSNDTLDAFIEALIEHRTYVFGRRHWSADAYPEQTRGVRDDEPDR